MSFVSNLIPPKRLKLIPKEMRLAHEYCFFLHDEFTRILVEYETKNAHLLSLKFKNKKERKLFAETEKSSDVITALRAIGRHDEARRGILSTITLAMVSDCAHHIYESLKCFEKRKIVPAFNLLRKPLLDNLMYIAWMVADEDDFYKTFTSGDPKKISPNMIGNRRKEILQKAIEKTELNGIVDADEIISIVFDIKYPDGLYGLFQHAVHLVTVQRIEIQTLPENFNFIFKSPLDDDIYEALYSQLPTVLLFLAHAILVLFERISPADEGSKKAFTFRTINAYRLLHEGGAVALTEIMNGILSSKLKCSECASPFRVTPHNTARLLLSESYRCPQCRRVLPFPFSWIF